MYIIMKRKLADGVKCGGVSEHILSFRYVIMGYKITENILDYEGL